MAIRLGRPAKIIKGLISRWDLMRVPADQGLMLTAFTAAGAVLSILFWSVFLFRRRILTNVVSPRKSRLSPTSTRRSRSIRGEN